MKFNPEIHHRRSIRLPGYNYAQNGAYFITMCTQSRETLFGEIVGANGVRPNNVRPEMIHNEYGEIVADEWLKSASIRMEIATDEFVIMPNHFHGIVLIHGKGDRQLQSSTYPGGFDWSVPHWGPIAPTEEQLGPKPKSLGAFIAGFKSAITKRSNIIRQMPGVFVWQRNYYEHIVRNDHELNRIREYIQNNPANWDSDRYNPSFVGAAQIINPSW